AMSAFDLTNQCTEPEIEYITPRVKLRDDMLVFVDGKWVNEICCQPLIASHQKLFRKKAQNEWSIWEKNRALWEENQALRIENRMLWEENKSLQCLQSQNRAVQVIYTDAVQQSLQKENKPFPFFQERNVGFQVRSGNKSLQQVQNRVLQDLQQENKTAPIIWKDEKAITVHEESKDAGSDLQQGTDTITAVEKGNPGPAPPQEHEPKEKSTTRTQDKIKSAPSMQGEYEIIWALQDLYQLLHIFLKDNCLLEEDQGCHILHSESRSFEEDYNELKQQLKAVKNIVSDIRAQMEMLEKELFAITSPMYEKAGQKLATEHQLGEI
ncbi:SPERT protein, partial [Rhinoptilus africanus]|nr:SPERT protein [Rhinoptilus africanus]